MQTKVAEADLMINQAQCFARHVSAMRYGDSATRKSALEELNRVNHERLTGFSSR
jgi:hypothetical protein